MKPTLIHDIRRFALLGALLCIVPAWVSAQISYSNYLNKSQIVPGAVVSAADPDTSGSSEGRYVRHNQYLSLNYTTDGLTDVKNATAWRYEVIVKLMNPRDTTQYFNDTLSIQHNDSLPRYRSGMYYDLPWGGLQARVLQVCAKMGNDSTCTPNPETYPLLPADIELEISVIAVRIESFSDIFDRDGSEGIYNLDSVVVDCKLEYDNKRALIDDRYDALRNDRLNDALGGLGYTGSEMTDILDEISAEKNLLVTRFIDTVFTADTTYIRACGGAGLFNPAGLLMLRQKVETDFEERFVTVVKSAESELAAGNHTLAYIRNSYANGVFTTLSNALENHISQIQLGVGPLAGCYGGHFTGDDSLWLARLTKFRNDYINTPNAPAASPAFNDSLYWNYRQQRNQIIMQTDAEYAGAVLLLNQQMYSWCGYGGTYYSGCEDFYQRKLEEIINQVQVIKDSIRLAKIAKYNVPAVDIQEAQSVPVWKYSNTVWHNMAGEYAAVNNQWLACIPAPSHGAALAYLATSLDDMNNQYIYSLHNARQGIVENIYRSSGMVPDSARWVDITDSLQNVYYSYSVHLAEQARVGLSGLWPASSACIDSITPNMYTVINDFAQTFYGDTWKMADSILAQNGASLYREECARAELMGDIINSTAIQAKNVLMDSVKTQRDSLCAVNGFEGFPTVSYFACRQDYQNQIVKERDILNGRLDVLTAETDSIAGIGMPGGWEGFLDLLGPLVDEYNYRFDTLFKGFTRPCFSNPLDYETFVATVYFPEETEADLFHSKLKLPLDSTYDAYRSSINPTYAGYFYPEMYGRFGQYYGARSLTQLQRFNPALQGFGIDTNTCITDSVMSVLLTVGGQMYMQFTADADLVINTMATAHSADSLDFRLALMNYATKESYIKLSYEKGVRSIQAASDLECVPLQPVPVPGGGMSENDRVLACQADVDERAGQRYMQYFVAMDRHIKNALGADSANTALVNLLNGRWLATFTQRYAFNAPLDSIDQAWLGCVTDTGFKNGSLTAIRMAADNMYFKTLIQDNGTYYNSPGNYYLNPTTPLFNINQTAQKQKDSLFVRKAIQNRMGVITQAVGDKAAQYGISDSCITQGPDNVLTQAYFNVTDTRLAYLSALSDSIVGAYPTLDADSLAMKLNWIMTQAHAEGKLMFTEYEAFQLERQACGQINPNLPGGGIENPVEDTVILKKLISLKPTDDRYLRPISTGVLNQVSPTITVVTESGSCGITKHLEWTPISGAIEYDLEWVYIDNAIYLNGVKANTMADIAYRAFSIEEPIRVTVAENRYPYPGEYPNGKLYFRVRGVARIVDNVYQSYDQPQFMPWGYNWQGYGVTASAVDFNGSNPFNATFENNLNWQWECTFAEEGKFKRVISYHDGLNRARQVVTHLSTDNLSVIGETLYDHEGRPAVQVLPYPETCYELSYRHDTRADTTGTDTFDKEDFELRAGSKIMETSKGSSEYYSALNPFMAVENPLMHTGAIPDAEKYPYSQTTFMYDNTGRPTASGGVGAMHRVNGEHATQYFFANASETELRRLFGKNVGIALHYKKNAIVDANKQLSIAYVDQEGRTIATALAGTPPANLDPLPSYQPELFTQSLNQNNIYNPQTHTWETAFNHLNEQQNGEASFVYKFDKDLLLTTSIPGMEAPCILCEFDLQISVTDPDGNPVELTDISGAGLSGSATSVTVHLDNDVYGAVDPCSTTTCSNCEISFTAAMPKVGVYRIHKKLVWDEQGAFAALTAALNPTVNTYTASVLQTTTTQFVEAIEPVDCNLFPGDGFGSILEDDDYTENYNAATQTECRSMLLRMINQIIPWNGPAGQTPPMDGAGMYYNQNSFWSRVVELRSGTYTGTDPYQINPAVIPANLSLPALQAQVASWPFEWKEEIVKAHPEYCWYLKCTDYSAGTDFNAQMGTITQLSGTDGGRAKGYMNPTNMGSLPGSYSAVSNTSFTRVDAMGISAYAPDINGKLLEDDDLGSDIWDRTTQIQSNFTPAPGSTATSSQAGWQTFRGGYLQAKTDAFYIETDVAGRQCQLLDVGTAVVIPPPDEAGIISDVENNQHIWDEGGAMCEDLCEQNARAWRSSLFVNCGEPFTDPDSPQYTDWQKIKDYLYEYCMGQCGPNNPMGIITDRMMTEAMAVTDINDPRYWLKRAVTLFNDNFANSTGCQEIFATSEQHGGDTVLVWETPFTYANGEYTEDCHTLTVSFNTAYAVSRMIEKINAAYLNMNSAANSAIMQSWTTGGGLSVFFNRALYHSASLEESCLRLESEACPERDGGLNPCDDCSIVYYTDSSVPDVFDVLVPPARIRKIKNPAYILMTVDGTGKVTVPVIFERWTLDASGNYVSFDADIDGRLVFNVNGCCTDEVCTILPPPWDTIVQPDTLVNDCITTLVNQAQQDAQTAFQQWLEEYTQQLWATVECSMHEDFKMTYTKAEHHYTLYYFDQAGNLVQTVPPQGVHPLAQTAFSNGIWNGTSNPLHNMESRYKYNSLEVALQSETPDGGLTYYRPDAMGRPNESRNAEQRLQAALASQATDQVDIFSKTVYDLLGRIDSVYEQRTTVPQSGPVTVMRTQITRTKYDESVSVGPVGWLAQNTRARVAAVEYYEAQGGALRHGTYYSYDIHGNVKSLLTDVPALDELGQRFHRTDYYYDLVSGKVNEVHYQPKALDRMFYRYTYDADNRLVTAETSRDYVNWERDAKYFYYPHGPLKRVETGHRKIQGSDYFYTIHGWLKGVNSGALNETYDVGRDGDIGLAGNPHKFVARDAYGFTLDYYNGDYKNIGTGMAHIPYISGTTFESYDMDGLYNGNIIRMSTALLKIDETRMEVLGNKYYYDQLNRFMFNTTFTSTDLHTGNTWDGVTFSSKYADEHNYDANGNITDRKHRDYMTNVVDELTYGYLSKAAPGAVLAGTEYNYVGPQNRLDHVSDATGDSDYQNDFDGNTTANYTYDEIGNLTGDLKEEIAQIKWTVYGKVSRVVRTASSTKPDLDFFYDGMGRRYMKVVKPKNPNGTLKNSGFWTFTYYQHDAQGNILAIYDIANRDAQCGYEMYLSEHVLYGSSRLGTNNYGNKVKLGTMAHSMPYYSGSAMWICSQNTDNIENGQLTPVSPGTIGIGGLGGILLSPGGKKEWTRPIDLTRNPLLERPIGVANFTPIDATKPPSKVPTVFEPGNKRYEFSNHLGNVLVTISDKPIGIDTDSNGTANYYMPNVISTSDYQPFGAPLPERTESEGTSYRFAFNGKEKTDEWSGEGNIYDYGFRIYDPRIARFLSVDPLTQSYPWYTPYQFAGNNPVKYVDLDGLEQAFKDPCSDYITPASDYLNNNPVQSAEFLPGGVQDGSTIVPMTTVDKLIGMLIAFPIQTVAEPLNVLITGQTSNGEDASPVQHVEAAINLVLLGAAGDGEGPGGGMKRTPIEGAPVDAPYAPKELVTPQPIPTAATPAQTVSTAAVNLEARATAIHKTLSPITQSKTTVAAAEVVNAEGVTETWVASSEKSLRPAQRAALKSNEVAVKGVGHAETTIINAAKAKSASVVRVAASRPICTNCQGALTTAGAAAASALKVAKKPG